MRLDKMQQSPNHPTLRAQRARVVPIEQYAREQAEAWRHFGQLLRAERLTRGKTRAEVLAVMGYSPAHHDYVLTDIEMGRQEVTVEQARQLDQLLGMPAVHLMVQAGVATLAQLAATGDDMPLAGRPITLPATARCPHAHRRVKALAVLAVIVSAVLAVAALLLFTAGHFFPGALVLAAAWIAFSPPVALVTARMIARGHGKEASR